MYRNLLNLLTCVLLLPACSGTAPHISIVCEENNVGNSIVKWEIAPLIKGNVKVYASTDPNNIPEDSPVAIANISDQRMTIVTTDPTKRYYYTLVFNDKYRVKIATRNVNIPGIQNFRDMGGYPSYPTKKRVRWGMLYRSAQIDSLECYSRRELKNIGIKTIIDLRSESELKGHTPLQNSTNYPVVIHCSSGKGRTGIASALILASLGVNSDIIMEDYRLSNDYFNIPSASSYAYNLPTRSQEAITTIYSAREDFLNAAKEEIERRYGDVDTYLQRAIGLTKEEIKKLQSILLVKND